MENCYQIGPLNQFAQRTTGTGLAGKVQLVLFHQEAEMDNDLNGKVSRDERLIHWVSCSYQIVCSTSSPSLAVLQSISATVLRFYFWWRHSFQGYPSSDWIGPLDLCLAKIELQKTTTLQKSYALSEIVFSRLSSTITRNQMCSSNFWCAPHGNSKSL